jgi:hypothetical protein
MIGTIVSVADPLAPCAQAQQFTLLEHRYARPGPVVDQGLWTSEQAQSRVLLNASYR